MQQRWFANLGLADGTPSRDAGLARSDRGTQTLAIRDHEAPCPQDRPGTLAADCAPRLDCLGPKKTRDLQGRTR
eukprot:11029008-Alexandrium_andersonii.AAC.1